MLGEKCARAHAEAFTWVEITLLKTFKGSDFESHIFRNMLGKILPDRSPV